MKLTADMLRKLSSLKDIKKSMIFKIAFALGEQSGEDRANARWMKRLQDIFGAEIMEDEHEGD